MLQLYVYIEPHPGIFKYEWTYEHRANTQVFYLQKQRLNGKTGVGRKVINKRHADGEADAMSGDWQLLQESKKTILQLPGPQAKVSWMRVLPRVLSGSW